jgi:NitT/TauT family transport system substrate-binding protein
MTRGKIEKEAFMQIRQNRRHFLAGLSATGAAGILGPPGVFAAEGPPEVTTVRLPQNPGICLAPGYIAEELLRTEGFTEIRYVPSPYGFTTPELVSQGELDFGFSFASSLVYQLDAGMSVSALAGIHSGCYELFAHGPVRTISDLKGRTVGIQTLTSSAHLYVAIMAAHVGLDPHQDIEWVVPSSGSAMELFAEREVDAFIGFPPEPQELRHRGIGRMILNTSTDRPWSQYLCCILYGNRQWIRDHPVATKRFVRAILKAADICASDPERAARALVDEGFTPSYDYALQTLTEVPYDRWREFDAEDTMRFYALRLHQVGMIQSTPRQLLAEGTDWRFLRELKRELKT